MCGASAQPEQRAVAVDDRERLPRAVGPAPLVGGEPRLREVRRRRVRDPGEAQHVRVPAHRPDRVQVPLGEQLEPDLSHGRTLPHLTVVSWRATGTRLPRADTKVRWSRTSSALCRRARAPATPTRSDCCFERHATAIYAFCLPPHGPVVDRGGSALRRVPGGLAAGAGTTCRRGEGPPLAVRDRDGTCVRNRSRCGAPRYRAALARASPAPRAGAAADEPTARLGDLRRRCEPSRVRRGSFTRREQDVLVLCGWCELSYEDAALALGVPIGTVRSRLSPAPDRRLREPRPGERTRTGEA